MSNNKALPIGLAVAVALPIAILGYLRYQSQEAPGTERAPPAAASAQGLHAQAEPPPTDSQRPETGNGTRTSLEARLDKIAEAYNAGNIKAIELALFPNHAVVRPNGEHLDRAGVLLNWQEEWQLFPKRELRLAVLSFEQRGDEVSASWTVDLRADTHDEDGEVHVYEFHGVQEARYRLVDGQPALASPITYSSFEQTMDGEPWGGSQ